VPGEDKGPITTLFLDIGGVLLSNGWDHNMRRVAADRYGLDYDDMNGRHYMTFGTYEEGKIDLDTYLDRVVFNRKRSFSREEYKQYMYAQSKPHTDMLDLVRGLKSRYGLRVAAVSNEGRELMVYRIETFKLREITDFFIASCFVHFRKPDEDMYRMALDVSQARPKNVLYLDDREMFVEVARGLGIHGVHHTDYVATRRALSDLGLSWHED
jgi:putative hydrolase of the HAD superfamily